MYDPQKLNKLEYINKNPEIKNIYRSYNAFNILASNDNLLLILNFFEDALERIIHSLKDALEYKSNASLSHFSLLLRALIVVKP